jgi:hypothetical protein
MRRLTPAIFAIAAIILATAGCDSEQPATSPSTTATLSIKASADVDKNFCWDVWSDLDGNGDCEFDNQQKYCETADGGSKNTRPVPWRYSAQVSILRAGTTTPQIIASSVVPGDTVPDYVSLTPYDPVVEPGIPKPSAEGICYLNGVKVSRGTQYFVEANGYIFGPPNVITHTPVLEFELALGDTVIVEARKQAVFDAPNYLQAPDDTSDVNLYLTGVLLVGSGEVQVNGTTSSSAADKAGFSFSYTRR